MADHRLYLNPFIQFFLVFIRLLFFALPTNMGSKHKTIALVQLCTHWVPSPQHVQQIKNTIAQFVAVVVVLSKRLDSNDDIMLSGGVDFNLADVLPFRCMNSLDFVL